MNAFRILLIICIINVNYINLQTSEPSCNRRNCKEGYGECANDVCICGAGYTTIETNSNKLTDVDFTYCNYAFRYKDWAANFEALLPFGAGHFYTLRYLHGMLKFILFWFLSLNRVIFKKRRRLNNFIEKMYSISLWIFAIMYVVDYLCYTLNYYRDGNGMTLLA
jgi:hypothetical protein